MYVWRKYFIPNKRFLIPYSRSLLFTRKGICLNLRQVFAFYDNAAAVQEAFDKGLFIEKHLTGGVYLCHTPGFPGIDIRAFYKREDGLKHATRRGIHLRWPGWMELREIVADIVCLPETADFVRCSTGHLEGQKTCPLCDF